MYWQIINLMTMKKLSLVTEEQYIYSKYSHGKKYLQMKSKHIEKVFQIL